jgi:hypothetical protein
MDRLRDFRQLLTAKANINDVGAGPIGIDVGDSAEYTKIYVRFNAGTSAGAVVIEEASDPAYTGTWALLTTIAWSAATKESSYLVIGSYRALRARISVAVVGGNVDVWAQVTG